MTRERGDVLVDDFAYVVWHFEPLASDEVTVTCEPGRSLNEMDQSGCTQRGGRYSNVKSGRWVTRCLYPHIVRLNINRFCRVWCGSFRDQCPTDSSNPAEDLTLRVNRYSAYPVGAERIPYLR